jgi:hypothetical protein
VTEAESLSPMSPRAALISTRVLARLRILELLGSCDSLEASRLNAGMVEFFLKKSVRGK